MTGGRFLQVDEARLGGSAGAALVRPKLRSTGVRHFVGYRPDEVDGLLEGFEARVGDDPATLEVDDLVLAPLVREEAARFVGGAAHRPDLAETLSLHRGFGPSRRDLVHAAATPAVPVVELERAWFGGYLLHHFGHFLLEGLARVLSPAVTGSDDPVVFLTPETGSGLTGYMRAVFALAGVDPGRVRLCDAPLRVGRLAAQQPTFEIRGVVRPGPYRRLQPTVPGAGGPGGVLYLSRRQLVFQRRVRNEAALEARLVEELGATVRCPEDHPVDEQIAALAGADLVVGCEGSAFHTLMFVRGPSRAVVLCNGLPHLNYLLCDEVFDADVVYVQASGTGAGAGAGRGTDWDLDLDLAAAVVRAVEPA